MIIIKGHFGAKCVKVRLLTKTIEAPKKRNMTDIMSNTQGEKAEKDDSE